MTAGLCTLAAGLGAREHLRIHSSQVLTLLCACRTNGGARPAGLTVKGRGAMEELVAGAADADAVHQHADVFLRSEGPAERKAVRNDAKTRILARVAGFGTTLKI